MGKARSTWSKLSTRRRRVRAAVAVLATGMLVAGPFAAPAQAQQGAAKTLRVAIVTGINHLNPFTGDLLASTQIARLNYEFLTLPSAENTEPAAALAESWEAAPDKLSWTFHIRHGMKWSDGQPVTAKDAAFTFNRMMTDSVARTVNGSYVANFASVTATDDYTLVIKNKVPQANMLVIDVPIVPEHVWAPIKDLSSPETDSIAVVGVGDGPFTITDYKPGEYVKFKANKDYWRGAPKVDQVQWLIFKDAEAAVSALQNNEVDIINRLTPTQFNTLKGQPNITTNSAPGHRYNEIIMNFGVADNTDKPYGDGNPALKDIRVRKAIQQAIDPQTIVDRVMGGYAQVGTSVVPPIFADYTWTPTPAEKVAFDPAAANAALDQAGYPKGTDGIRSGPDGKKLNLRLVAHASRAFDQRTTEYITGWLKSIGIGVTPQLVSDDDVDARTTAGNFDLALSGWGTSPDPDYALSLQTCASRPDSSGKGASTDTSFCDPQFEALYKAQGTEFDATKRAVIVKQAQARLYSQAVNIVLDYDNALEAYRSDNFSSFTKQPQPNGVILEQTGYWGYLGATPAGTASASGSDSHTGLWIGIGVVVVLVLAGGGFFVFSRRKTADDRE